MMMPTRHDTAAAFRGGPSSTDTTLWARFAATRDRSLRDTLAERYLPLARSLAARYARGEEPFDDLMQVASIGLLKALDRFDPTRGIAFSSFAVPTITGEIRRHFRDRCWAVRPPRALGERALEVAHAADDLARRLGCVPTVRQIGEALDLSDERVLEAMQARQASSAISLDAPGKDGEGRTASLVDRIGGEDRRLEAAEHRATLQHLASDLTDRERAAIELRFAHDLTQTQIAKSIGVSQMQVSRLLGHAIAKLAKHASAADLAA